MYWIGKTVMKTRSKYIFQIILFLLLSGCMPGGLGSPTDTPGVTLTHTPEVSIGTPVPVSTPTNTVSLTATEAPASPTWTPTTITVTPTQTNTPEPTLTENQRKQRLFDLLKNNAGCKLPCWWGFRLGEVPWEEVRSFLLQMGVNTGDDPLKDGSVFHGTGGFDWSSPFIANDIDFYDLAGIVEAVIVRTEGYDDLDFFRTLWKSFSPEEVIIDYGPPSRVYVSAFHYGEINVTSSALILVFDDYGFFTWYETQALVVPGPQKPMLRICPSWSDLTWQPKLRMYIKGVDFTMTFDDLLRTLAGIDGLPGKSIEEAAGITPEQFYQRFQPGEGPACLETPEEMWQ